MKSVLISLIMFVSVSIGSAQWTQITTNTNYSLQKLFFVNDSTGYAAGQKGSTNGVILKTTNRGNSWDSTIFNNPFLSIFFPNKDTGYASTQSTMYKTNDGGNSWTPLSYNFPGGLSGKGLFFLNSDTGYFGNSGGGFLLYKTSDGGNNWTTQNYGPNSAIIDAIHFFDKDTGFIAGWYGPKIAKTTDEGNNWIDITNNYTVKDLFFSSRAIAYAVGGNAANNNPVIVKTTDEGNTWNIIYTHSATNNFDFFSSIYCLNNDICYAVGDSGTILKTIDGGNNWQEEASGTTKKLNSVFCTNSYCYAVGDSGVVLRTANTLNSINQKKKTK